MKKRQTHRLGLVEYIWPDGQNPSKLRSKTIVSNRELKKLGDIPEQSFDGSSTFQAEPGYSDLTLKPVLFCPDPIRGFPNILALCEVFKNDGKPHE